MTPCGRGFNTVFMTRAQIFIAVACISVMFAGADYLLNDYGSYFGASSIPSPNSKEDVLSSSVVPPKVEKLPTSSPTPPPKIVSPSKPSFSAIIEAAKTPFIVTNVSSPQTLFQLIPLEAIPFVSEGKTYHLGLESLQLVVSELLIESKKAELAYQVVQDTALTLKKTTFNVNITNKYGDASFYLNNKDRSDTAFLVVLYKGINIVYLFEYPKTLHDSVRQIISLLSSSYMRKS